MNQHIKDLVETIHDCKMTNTYKMSWCRSLVEWSVKNPNKNQEVFKLNMTPESGILYIPNNYANGAMNLTENNAVRYYSSLLLEESIKDDYRFESNFWNPWAEFNPNLYE